MDKGIRLKDMAESFDVTPSFLCAVENGRRVLPRVWLEKLAVYFEECGVEPSEWRRLAEVSRAKMSIDLSGVNAVDRETCMVFGQKYLGMSPEKKRAIRRMLIEE